MCLCWCSSSLHQYLSSLWALPWAFSNVIWAAAFTYYIYLDASWCPICVCWSSFWAWFWGFPTGIWAIPCQGKWHKHTCSLVEVLHHYIDIRAHFELCLELFPMWFELLPLHTTYTLVSYTCSFELMLGFPHWNLSYPMHKKTYVNICVPLLVFLITTSVFELTLSSVLGFFPMWFELLPLHTTYTLMHLDVLYVLVWAHFELDFEVSPLEFELSHAQKNMHKHMCTFVGVLHHYIGIWAHFELCLELFPMWFELLPLHTTYTSMHLDVLYMCLFELILSLILSFPHWNLSYPMPKHDINIRVAWLKLFITTSIFELILSSVLSFFQCDLSCCLYILHIPWCPVRVGLSSFWAWFWAFPIGIWAIPCQNMTSTYVYLCWCSSSLHRYLSSLWALSWAFSNVIWAAAFTYYIYLDASWCPICVCLSSFWAWFWVFPTGIWAIPCTKKHT